jgi:hypothetical protein
MAYKSFLKSKDIELESVVAWFFSEYLATEFNAAGFKFVPPSTASNFLEKSRHLFAEMEGVVKQFALYVKEGELDTGLLGIASEPVRYREIPSLMEGKYVYPSDDRDIRAILHLLFSDQSGLAYINESLDADDAATLFIENEISFDDLAEYQKADVEFLIRHGVLEHAAGPIRFTSTALFLVLENLYATEAVSYPHFAPSSRRVIDQMVEKGWVVRQGSLLSRAEASYFNYCLNQQESSNGPDLRNKYLHGSHVDSSDEDEHFRTYLAALKLLVALVIKINDDFWLQDVEGGGKWEGVIVVIS